MGQLHITVAGAGLIGQEHISRLLKNPRVSEVTVVDPVLTKAGSLPPSMLGARLAEPDEDFYRSADGVIVATPNALHARMALQSIAAGTPTLVEKPVANTEAEALDIVTAADTAEVAVLVGHHRRYSGALQAAHRVVESNDLGKLVAVTGSALFSKPSSYFDDAPWRRENGGGPLLINSVHDLDALRYLCGEIDNVRCVSSSKTRGFEVEDTAVLILEFANGALGTYALSDTASSFRSWEQTSGENPSYDRSSDQDCYHLAGIRGSLSVPTLRRSRADGEPSWWSESVQDTIPIPMVDPLTAQCDHFLDVVEGKDSPLVTARDGLQSLRLVAAAHESASANGAPVAVPSPPVAVKTR